jgi:Zn-ribbon protein, possibly nucleic acid-binding
MKKIYSTLSELQVVLAEMFKIEDEIKEIPKTLEVKEALLQKTRIKYLELHETSEKIKQDIQNLHDKVNEAGVKRETCEKMMETITQAREFETLQKEIEEAKTAEQNYRKQLLAKQNFQKDIEERLEMQEAVMAQQNEEVEEVTKEKDQAIAEKEAQLAVVKAKRDELAKDLDPNLLFKFERIIRNKGGKGIVAVHHIVCLGCYMQLPAQYVNEVRASTFSEDDDDEIKFCPYCSRVLFYEDSPEYEELEKENTKYIASDDKEEEESDRTESGEFMGTTDSDILDNF